MVDIGFHYIAVNSNAEPGDWDGDGLPDYIEDSDGDGTADSGETDWQAADTDGDGVSDFNETLLGRSPLVQNVTTNGNGAINLRIFTPLK